jgi:crotonobetainyl-CoA:carnitine CoA-transferase CaiB-like acyl-CoA transferase
MGAPAARLIPAYDPPMPTEPTPDTAPAAAPARTANAGRAAAPQPSSGGPLAGILVADCSTVLAGPYCTMLLADLGAEVVKVEPPEGDGTRAWGPPWVGAGATGPDDPGVAAYYLAVNRNKRSIRLDLKADPGRDVLRRLLARADVLVENARVGGYARLGFDDASLDSINPRLVHLAISGYGPDGPEAGTPGYDFIIQAVSGLMSITGFPDEEGGRPTKVGVAISDVTTGMLGAVAVLAAIGGRDRAGSPAFGRGQRIDISLLESTFAWLVNQAQNLFAAGAAPGRRGNAHPNIAPYETFATSDGEIAVAVGSERQWARFVEAVGMPEIGDDVRFATNGARVAHRHELRPLLGARFKEAGSADWLSRLEAAEVPCGPLNDLAAALASPQARARGVLVDVEHPALGMVRQVAPPFALSRTPASVRTAPPLLGEHSAEILAELGYGSAEIEALRATGVI